MIMTGFCFGLHHAFGRHIKSYSSLALTVDNLFYVILGEFDYGELKQASPIHTHAYELKQACTYYMHMHMHMLHARPSILYAAYYMHMHMHMHMSHAHVHVHVHAHVHGIGAAFAVRFDIYRWIDLSSACLRTASAPAQGAV